MKSKKITLHFFYFFLTGLVYFHIFYSFFLYNNKLISQTFVVNIDKSVYYISFNNRYIYFDIFDNVTCVSDIEYPKFIKVVFSSEEENRQKELDFVKSFFWIPQIISINFPKKQIFCYNNVILNYYDLGEIMVFFETHKTEFLQDLKAGEYFLMGQSVFNIHDRGL